MAEQNADQIADWNDQSGERWVAHQARLDAVVAVFGKAAIEAAAPVAGERVSDRTRDPELRVDERPVEVEQGNWHGGSVTEFRGTLPDLALRPLFTMSNSSSVSKGIH